ncbi:MAG: mucoidy inhibitor MuiA family protein [Pseudomonadales bacterium]|jgi:uncharacterized protein (TIGR02231 family)|nr:mucoidy inhibitor MuiA family protein [Pseudomonadales bacterium]
MHSWIRFALLAALGLGALHAVAQSQPVQKVQLQEAIVFLRGAQLTSSITLDVPVGDSEWVLSNVAGNINEQSLSVAASSGVVVQFATVRNDYLEEEVLSPRAVDIKRQRDEARAAREQIDVQAAVVAEQIEMIRANRQLGGDKGAPSAAEIGRMFDLLDQKMKIALLAKNRLNQQLEKAREREEKFERQFNEEKARGFQPGGRIAVKLYAPQAARSTLTLSYVVPEAGWMPSYDLQASKVGAPVQLTYKARVFQNSGIHWDKVHLLLSSGNPAQSAQAPVFAPVFLSLLDDQPAKREQGRAYAAAAGAPAPMVAASAPATPRPRQAALDGYVSTNANGIDTQFDIALPYSIPSDGKGHLVMIKSAQLAATYRYVVMPKRDADAFLQAQVSGWGDLDLLPGQSNIFYEGNYVGQGYIDVTRAKESLDISLGRDKRILVKRDSDPAFKQGPQFFGSDVRQQFGITITARNTRKEAIDLVVIDQIPVSRDSDVRIEDLNHGKASLDAATGELRWTLPLTAGEAATLPFSYTVRYPKDRTLLGL